MQPSRGLGHSVARDDEPIEQGANHFFAMSRQSDLMTVAIEIDAAIEEAQ